MSKYFDFEIFSAYRWLLQKDFVIAKNKQDKYIFINGKKEYIMATAHCFNLIKTYNIL